ncbi:class I adenylate-forming enzyme family protein [Roseomonas chloroacetimidivorans]|uniref:class I adenylate-forming enzyme family protein n=1 Tax=Roseomonas chloroacetimidivorans TaxID=1766656 RepID=UPI003C7654A1
MTVPGQMWPSIQGVGASASAARAAGLTVAALFHQQAGRAGSRIAIEDGSGVLSYEDLAARVHRLTHALHARGVRRGDRIALLSENRREYIELQLAAAQSGAILACQNWRQSDAELAHCLRLVAPRLVFVSERHTDRLRGIEPTLAETLVLGGEYEALIRATPAGPAPDMAEPEDGLVILYASGTTGLPKAAVISHRAMIARGAIARMDEVFFPDRAFVAWTPLFHMGATDSSLAAMMHGAKVIVMDGFDPPAIADLVERERIGWLALMPGMFSRMIAELRGGARKPLGIGVCGSMADLVPLQEIAEVTRLLQAPFRNSFGSTETGSAPLSRGRIPIGVVPERLSKELSAYWLVRLVDEDGQDVRDGEPGEVACRGPGLFSGYWGDAEANVEAFRGGWYHMGDVFRRNPDGTYDFVDRRKYLIKSGGENIYPAEIERVLLASPRIAEAAVVRQPDARWGEVPVAFVAPRDAALGEADVVALCQGAIAGYKVPKAVHFLPESEFPRSTSGKVQRHTLEARLRNGTKNNRGENAK